MLIVMIIIHDVSLKLQFLSHLSYIQVMKAIMAVVTLICLVMKTVTDIIHVFRPYHANYNWCHI